MKHILKKEALFIRLTKQEVSNIKTSVLSIDLNAKVYLFGSRVDPTKRGGDIDLLIISKIITRKDLSKIRWSFFEQFGEQKMDIVVDNGSMFSPFVKMIFPKAVQL